MPSVAVPEVDKVVVISSSEIFEAVTVSVTVVPEFSANDTVDDDRLTLGYIVG